MMSTDTLLAFLEERGLKVELTADGTPTLRGPKEEATPALLDVLKMPVHREEIVRRLKPPELPKPPPLREWLWRTGHRYTAEPEDRPDWNPAGAWWFRLQGETQWRAVPGRPGETTAPPEGS
jgi:hypothetical protein